MKSTIQSIVVREASIAIYREDAVNIYLIQNSDNSRICNLVMTLNARSHTWDTSTFYSPTQKKLSVTFDRKNN